MTTDRACYAVIVFSLLYIFGHLAVWATRA